MSDESPVGKQGSRARGAHVASDELLEHWARTERLLREALAQVSVEAAPRRWVEEYLDHNELGFAYATLVENVARPLPDRARAVLTDAASAMSLDAPAA